MKAEDLGSVICYLWWDPDQAPGSVVLKAVASIGIERKFFDTVWAALQKATRSEKLHPSEREEIYCFEPVPEDKTTDFESQLDALLGRWIGLWRKVGGVRALTKGK